MSRIRVGINGFGRIGRTFFRLAFDRAPHLELVVINDLGPAKTLAHLLKYDSIHGTWDKNISVEKNSILVNQSPVDVLNKKTIEEIPWDEHEIDVVIECTGKFKTHKELSAHIKGAVQKVILSAPSSDDSIKTVVLGVNERELNSSDVIISNASCTTNNAAPMVKIIDQLCDINQLYITTVHSFTSDQSLHDQIHHDLRRARAATQSIIPTTTGAAKALTKIFPHLAQSMGGCGIRVPVSNGSLTDITFVVDQKMDVQTINNAFRMAAGNQNYDIINYTEDPIVSSDVNNSLYSCTFDSMMTSVIGNMIKIIGWYDNETGYSSRLIDLIDHVAVNK
ncbi:MAG: type I glyceraldehyde-3-phosphate dehydrogenase [Flavobacteriaceae bacterium]|nr:type I glyceraldehyde-3-phosphate dehydrogenase [Flavobacteriaceae bacterium]OUX39065.1 MAG: type I glyceraldehyde-3-phosphate dehydrogenase [Flavobacteriaceae bacterium TMED265]